MSTAKQRVNLLDVIPFCSKQVTTERVDDGTVVIVYPRFKRAWIRRVLLPNLSADIRICLEINGTAVWNEIDGRKTVGEIIKKLAAHFDGEENYEQRVITYIYQLQKDGFITYLLPGQP